MPDDTAATAATATAAARPAAAAADPAAAITPPGNIVAGAGATDGNGGDGAKAGEAGAAAAGDDGAKPKEGDGEGEGKKPDATNDKPIEYADFKMPEGVEVDDKLLTDFKAAAAEAKLPQEAAQKMVDLFNGKAQELAEAPYRLWNETQTTWQNEVKADPEIGGANFEPMKASIANAIDAIGGDQATAMREAFNYTGAGNNPAVIRLLYRLSQAVNEGDLVPGGKPAATGQKSAAETLYPAQGKQST